METQTYKILHLSDIHFGKTHDHMIKQIPREGFDLVIVTGDLTQRARSEQFVSAEKFLSEFKCPVFVIPGNHDVPLKNVFLRWFTPYRKYRKFIAAYLNDYYEDERVSVYGLWTLNRFTVQSGKLYQKQLDSLKQKMAPADKGKIRIIAAHHPLIGIDPSADQAKFQQIMSLCPDLMLWGHEHQSSASYFDPENKKGPVLLAAGTAFSSRTRTETNSFNVIHLNGSEIKIERLHFLDRARGFAAEQTQIFERNNCES